MALIDDANTNKSGLITDDFRNYLYHYFVPSGLKKYFFKNPFKFEILHLILFSLTIQTYQND